MAETALWNIKEINEHKRIVEQKTGASENTKVNKTRENVKTASAENNESEENVKTENNTANDDGVVKFNFAEMGMEEFNRQTLNNIKLRGGILINSITELIENIENALNGNNKVNMYFGAISEEVKDRIVSDVGQQIFKDNQYAIVVSYDDIVHISEHFGYDVNKIAEEILKLYDIIKNYDTVNLEITDKNMKKLIFDKSYSDYDYRTVEIVSNKKNTLDLVTFFVTKNNKKNRSQSVPPAVDNGLQWGSASDNSISQDDTPVNTQYMQELNKKYITAVKNDNFEAAQKLVDKAAERAGYTIRAYHGTSRGDRVGNVFLPERATSGPMAFFTSSKDIASNYAKDKADTSLAYDEEYEDYYSQFRVNYNGKSISVSEYWNKLSFVEKQKIKEKAKHVTFDDEAENIIYDENVEYGAGGFMHTDSIQIMEMHLLR